MTEKTNDEVVNEIIRLIEQTEKIIKATYVVIILTIIAEIILIMFKLGII